MQNDGLIHFNQNIIHIFKRVFLEHHTMYHKKVFDYKSNVDNWLSPR